MKKPHGNFTSAKVRMKKLLGFLTNFFIKVKKLSDFFGPAENKEKK
jgi:hypothetical protein